MTDADDVARFLANQYLSTGDRWWPSIDNPAYPNQWVPMMPYETGDDYYVGPDEIRDFDREPVPMTELEIEIVRELMSEPWPDQFPRRTGG